MDEKPLNLLLIEDDPNDVLLIKYFLAERGPGRPMKIAAAATLAKGRGLLEGQSFDAAILDLGLPDSRGIGSLLGIRARHPELPVIVLTALRDESVALEALALGAQDYLIKGMINGYFLRMAIVHAIERARQAAQFENVLAQDPDGKLIVNAKGTICYANAAAESFLGRRGEELLGKPLPYALPAEGAEEVKTLKPGAEEKRVEISAALIRWRKATVRLATLREIKPVDHAQKTRRREAPVRDGMREGSR